MRACDSPPPCLVSLGRTQFGGTSTSTKETPDKAEGAEGQLEVGTHSLAIESPGDF